MTGTLINVAAIILGSLIGLVAGNRIPEKMRQTLVSAMGLFTLAYGVFIFGQTQNMLIPLFALVVGTVIGELLKIEEGLNGLGEFIQQKLAGLNPNLSGESQKFVTGFVSASLLFCIGPMAILGSIQDGISGDFQMLAIKIAFGWNRLDCICVHPGCRRCVFGSGGARLSGCYQPVGRIDRSGFWRHDRGRNDRYRGNHLSGHCHQ